MKSLVAFLLFLCTWTTGAFAAYVAVLETSADASARENVSLSDRQYLTNVLREQAVKELPATQNYTIMTRENIQQMLPPGKAIEDCEGSCLVETGKNIAADYICQARVGRFGSSITLSAELYETAGNKLIASFNGRGENVERLLELIENEAPRFFRVVREISSPAIVPVAVTEYVPEFVAEPAVAETKEKVSAEPVSEVPEKSEIEPAPVTESSSESEQAKAETPQEDSAKVDLKNAAGNVPAEETQVGKSVPANVAADAAGAPAKKGKRWIPVSFSAVVTVAGVALAVVGNSKAKTASEKKYSTVTEYRKYHDDAKSGQTLRGVGVGLAIAGAVGVCFSLVF